MQTSRKLDGNHNEIVGALRGVGASIIDTSSLGRGAPDLICGFGGETYLIEIKNPATKGKLNKRQKLWHATWKGPIYIVYSIDEALKAIGAV